MVPIDKANAAGANIKVESGLISGRQKVMRTSTKNLNNCNRTFVFPFK
jgi:hypothetical protein